MRQRVQRVLIGLTVGLAVGACAEGVEPPASSAVARIEGGTFTMGGADRDPCGAMAATTLACEPLLVSELIQHEVAVEPYCLDRSEVTVEQYRHCVAHGECSKPQLTNTGIQGQDNFIRRYYNEPDRYADYPVVGITRAQAAGFCAWKGGRLPSEVEWEYAATSRGTAATVWGDTGVDLKARVENDCTGSKGKLALGDCAATVQPVGTADFDRTEQGVSDLAGNVAEWVADEFDFLAYCENKSGYEVDRTQRDYELVMSNGIPSDVLADATCLNPCDAAYDQCRTTCGQAFNGNSPSDVARREWRARSCREAFKGDARLPDVTGLTQIGCDPADTAWCEANADAPAGTCEAFCGCLEADVPDATFDGAACHNACLDDWTTCAQADGCAPEAAVACDISRNRPTTWCVPRVGATSRDVRTEVPRALAFRDNQTTWVVRGGDVTDGALCGGRPTRRQARDAAQSTVGFRCAYDLAGGQCPTP